MNRAAYRRVAWVTLAALLFSAASPALAALFVDRAEFAARILGVRPAQAASPAPLAGDDNPVSGQQGAGDHDHAAHQQDGHGEHDEHAAHGVFCSFCLSASTQAAFPVCPLTHAAPATGGLVLDATVAPFVTRFTTSYQPRGPPAG